MNAKEFAEKHQYDLEEHDEGGYLGINENTFAKLLDEYAEAKAKEAWNAAIDAAAEGAEAYCIQNVAFVEKQSILNLKK